MQYTLREPILTWFDSYNIYDEKGKKAYTVKGKKAWGHRLEIENDKGKTVATVKEKMISVMSTFEFYRGNDKVGKMKKEFSLLKPKYDVDLNDWKTSGNVLEWNYKIKDKKGKTVATVYKQLLKLRDTYIIDVVDDKNALDVLMLVLALDAERCAADRKNDN